MNLVSSALSTVRNWWLFLIKGLLLLAAGVAILIRPAEGYVGLSVLFSVIIFCVGLAQIAFAAGNRAWLSGWGWTLASGIIDLTIGLFLIAFPGVSMATLPFFVGFWLMLRAFYLMGIAFDLNHSGVKGWGWLLMMGIFTLVFSWLVLFFPLAGAVGIVYYSAAAFIAGGAGALILAFKLRGAKHNVEHLKKDLKEGLA
ncbi:MAG TPA: DUF308 domain-containing protein [Puia sp.]|nr:DUF308 domain-containing protein [Puia sp.]